MPIIALCKETDEGATRHQEGDHVYYTRKEYVGCCISESESNGAYDSDFYMRVWDEKSQSVKSICFASTRGWSYPCYGSSVDATPEVLAKVEAWRKRQERNFQASCIRAVRKQASAFAKTLNVTRKRAFRLMKACDTRWKLDAMQKLMTANLRSEFKIKLREQVKAWLADESPKYDTPLSEKQFATLHPMRYATVYQSGYNRDSLDRYNSRIENYELIKRFAA